MGYYTSHTLNWLPREPEVSIYLEANADDFYGVDAHGQMADSCKWYEHEKYMRILSKQFPKILFTLEGEGEDAGDVWKKYFLGGKMQACRAELVFPKFDLKKLQ